MLFFTHLPFSSPVCEMKMTASGLLWGLRKTAEGTLARVGHYKQPGRVPSMAQ